MQAMGEGALQLLQHATRVHASFASCMHPAPTCMAGVACRPPFLAALVIVRIGRFHEAACAALRQPPIQPTCIAPPQAAQLRPVHRRGGAVLTLDVVLGSHCASRDGRHCVSKQLGGAQTTADTNNQNRCEML